MNLTRLRMTGIIVLMVILLTACGAVAEKTILVSFTGDCTLGSEESTRGREDSFDSMAAAKGYDYFFQNFRSFFEADDLTVINFEGVFSDSAAQESQSKRYRFRGPTEYVKILTGSSINAASLANNHTGDYGKQGEESTKKTLEENGISWFRNSKYFLFHKDGIGIAFFSLENKTLNNEKEYKAIKKAMKDLKESGEASAVVICWHTGHEYRGAHESNTERVAHILISSFGADLLIMHHPHVLQGVDIYKNRMIFYSLGNFVFGGNSAIRTEKYKLDQTVSSLYSMMVQVRFTFSNEGKYLGQQVTVYPAFTSSANPANNYQPVPVIGEDAEAVRSAIQEDTAFELPILLEEDGVSRMEFSYLPGIDEVMLPEGGDTEGPQGVPEAASAAPTRDNRSHKQEGESVDEQ